MIPKKSPPFSWVRAKLNGGITMDSKKIHVHYLVATVITATKESTSVTLIPPIRSQFLTLRLLSSLSLFLNELSNPSH